MIAPMSTKDKLVTALKHAGAPASMIVYAAKGGFDDFESESATPIMDLIRMAESQGLIDIANRAKDGEFDATDDEAEAWAKKQGLRK